MFWFAYRYHVHFLEIYELGIYLRSKIFLWQTKFYPFTAIQNIELREGTRYTSFKRLIIYLPFRTSYELLDTYCYDTETPIKLIKDRLSFVSETEVVEKCEICQTREISYRCDKCGILICDDCGDADQCMGCRLHALFRRALICFAFFIIPILCLIYAEVNLHLPFFTMYRYEFDMRLGPGYALLMWGWLNGLTGIGSIWLGFGFFFAGFAILKYEKDLVWNREKKIIIASSIMGIAILIMKFIYVIQVLIGFVGILKFMVALEVIIGELFLYFTVRISAYKSKYRESSEQNLWKTLKIVTIAYMLMYIVSAIIGIISSIAYIISL
jgi:hypothetical protein